MHLIVIIAIGVFAGLWLFAHWSEWREARLIRRHLAPYNPAPSDNFGAGLAITFFVVFALITAFAII